MGPNHCRYDEDGTPWPENFLITYALSLSKSHTAYGLRTGALIGIHPDEDVTERLRDIFGTTGRQTWSAAPRLLQYTASAIARKRRICKGMVP